MSGEPVLTDFKNKLMEWTSGNKEGRRRKKDREKGKRMTCRKRRKGERRDVGKKRREEKGKWMREE